MKPQSVSRHGFDWWVSLGRSVVIITTLAGVTPVAPAASNPVQRTGLFGLGNLPICFEANYGQAERPIRFIARGPAYSFSLSATEATVSLRKFEPAKVNRDRASTSINSQSLQLEFLGANPRAEVRGESELLGRVNYFIGDGAANWRTGVPLFERVRVDEMYSGIDLVHYGNQQHLEYDFEVAPGADPNSIAIRFSGADHIIINEQGELIMKLGDDEIRQPKPVIYQAVNGRREPIVGGYVLSDPRTVRFLLGKYDHTLPLVIDPVLSYSSYYGGGQTDEAFGVVVGTDGSIYVAGSSAGGLPTTVGSRTNRHTGNYDAFVAKFDSSGTNVIYLSYIGGSVGDTATALAVDASGNAYITGWTESGNFPRANAIFNQIKGVPYPPPFDNYYPAEAFVTKLGPLGTNLIYSTYLGGNYIDQGTGIAVDPAGNAYVAGFTQSPNFPTANVTSPFSHFDDVYPENDAFVTKIGPAGTNLIYSMYLGGSKPDQATDIAADAAGLAYVTGFTSSTNFPVTTNAVQPWLCGDADAFVTVIGSVGSNLVMSTYLGGSQTNVALGLALDGSLNVYLTGATYGDSAYPVSPSLINPGGVFRSSSGGLSWSGANNGLQSVNGLSLAVDPVNPLRVYAGTSRGIARSVDGGSTWNVALTVAPMPRIGNLGPSIAVGSVQSIAIDPLQPAIVYASTGQGVFKSIDAGVSWTLKATNQNALSSRALVVDPNFPAVLYVAGDAGVYRSSNGATNWLSANSGLGNQTVRSLAINPVASSTLYAATAGGVYRTTNRGTNWSAFNTGLTNLSAQALVINPLTTSTLFVGTAAGVFASTNAGSNWVSASVGLTTSNITALAINPLIPAILYAGTPNGLFKSTDSGATWTAQSEGLAIVEILSLAVNPQSPEILYTGVRGKSFFGVGDVFVTRLGNNGFSAVFGGANDDAGSALVVTGAGRVQVTGSTLSTDFPTLFAAGFLRARNSGGRDVFLSELSPDGAALLSSVYLGGSADDIGNAITLDQDENVYLVGATRSANFPTLGALQGTYRGSSDAFIAKIANIFFSPFLTIEPAGGAVRLSWSALASEYPLQSNTNLQTAGGWVNVGITPVETNGVLSVSLPATNTAQFFRLGSP